MTPFVCLFAGALAASPSAEPELGAAARVRDALIAVGPGADGGAGGVLAFSWRSAPGHTEEGTARGGLGLERRTVGYLGDGGESPLRFATVLSLGVVVVPWAGGAVKPYASLGPGIQAAMDLDAAGGGLNLGASLDLSSTVGADFLFGAHRRWGLCAELALQQPVLHLDIGSRTDTFVSFTAGVRLPRTRARMDRWADRLPWFGG